MQKDLNLKWKDIVSPTMSLEEYKLKNENNPRFKSIYESYKTDINAINKISNLIKSNFDTLRILVIGADWCGDCAVQVPRMIKLVENTRANSANIDFQILYGVKVDPYHGKKEIIWSKRHSIKEALDPKFNLIKIPMFYIFDNNGIYLGRIIEKPILESLELDLLKLLE